MPLESNSKLMFYPTDVQEIYRMLGVVGRLTVSNREALKEYIGETAFHNALMQAMNQGITDPMAIVYEQLISKGDCKAISKYFKIAFGYSSRETITIADMFAGEGKWLELFKTAIPHEELGSAQLHLIANELENNRYLKIRNNKMIDESYNKAFEEFNNLPQGSVSLMLYNPPYGEINGVRNVKHYLQMIIDEKLLFNSKGSNDNRYDNGKIIMVIRKDDVLDSLPLIVQHFEVEKDHIYKVNPKEYKKYKQYVVYASLRRDPLSKNNVNDALKLQKEVQEIADIINSEPEFDVKMYNLKHFRIPEVPYLEMKRNHEIVLEADYINSELDNPNWNWIKEMTELEDLGQEQIFKPTDIKMGELANIIASGMINGDMQKEDGTAKHIVAGGMKQQIKEEETTEELPNGKEQLVKKKMLYSEPYLNILISENGKAKVKELSGGMGGVLE